MQIVPYLNFNGNCAEAFAFYEKVLGGKIETMMDGSQAPPDSGMGDTWKDKVMHVHLRVGNMDLFGSDAPPQYYQTPQGYAVSLQVDDPAEAERLFNALAEGGEIRMPMEKTFWAEKFGMVTDRFGTPWMVNCDQAST